MTRAELLELIRWGRANDRAAPLVTALAFAAVPIFALLLESLQ